MVSFVTNQGRSVRHFLPPIPIKIPPVHRDAGKNDVSYLEKRPGTLGLVVAKALWSETPLIAQLPDVLAFYTEYIIRLSGTMATKDKSELAKHYTKPELLCFKAK